MSELWDTPLREVFLRAGFGLPRWGKSVGCVTPGKPCLSGGGLPGAVLGCPFGTQRVYQFARTTYPATNTTVLVVPSGHSGFTWSRWLTKPTEASFAYGCGEAGLRGELVEVGGGVGEYLAHAFEELEGLGALSQVLCGRRG